MKPIWFEFCFSTLIRFSVMWLNLGVGFCDDWLSFVIKFVERQSGYRSMFKIVSIDWQFQVQYCDWSSIVLTLRFWSCLKSRCSRFFEFRFCDNQRTQSKEQIDLILCLWCCNLWVLKLHYKALVNCYWQWK